MSKESAMTMAQTTAIPQASAAIPAENTAAPAAPTPTQADSDRFAAFARKEAEFVKKQQAWKTEREQWEKNDKARAEAVLKKAEEFETTRKSDPVAALRLIGFSETEIFNFLAAQEKKELTPEEKAAEAARKAAEETITQFKTEEQKRAEQAQLEADQKALEGFKSGLSSFVSSNKEKFPWCNHYGPAATAQAYQNVLQVVQDSKGEDIPTIEEAIQEMEELYEYQFQEMSKIKGLKAEVNPMPEKTENKGPVRTKTVSAPGELSAAKSAPRTVTNNRTAPAPSATETREQKKARLATQLAGLQKRA